MAKVSTKLSAKHIAFIRAQHVFFVASGCAAGHINLSPKGLDALRVLDEQRVAYLDITGSGNETAAHLMADGRLTMMFCSFGPQPLILRLHGRGHVVRPGDAGWDTLAQHFTETDYPGVRQIVVLETSRVQTSCGFGVPRMEFVEERQALSDWALRKGEDGLVVYRAKNNVVSIDGLPTGEPAGVEP